MKLTTPRTHVNLCTELGIIVIFDESELVPTQRLLQLEIDWNFTNCQVWPPFDAGTKLQYLLKLLIKTQRAPLAQLESIRGKICWMKKVVTFSRIIFHFFQALVTKHPKQGRHPRWINISHEAVTDLRWWSESDNLVVGTPLTTPTPDVTSTSNTSNEGLGATFEGCTMLGR